MEVQMDESVKQSLEATADAALESILGAEEEFAAEAAASSPEREAAPEPVKEAPADEEEDTFEAPISYDKEQGQDEEPTATWSKEDEANAFLALKRSGLDEETIETMSPEAMVRSGLKARERLRKLDAKLSALGQSEGVSDSTEAREGQAEFDASPATGEFDASAVGADLASRARPVVEKLMELDDPEAGAELLAGLVSEVSQQKTSEMLEALRLEQRAASSLEGRYEGDIPSLIAEAQALGAAGRHADKDGVERFDALLEDALMLTGSGVPRKQSTNRAKRLRGNRPPVASPGSKTRKAYSSESERLDAILDRITSDEPVTVDELRRM